LLVTVGGMCSAGFSDTTFRISKMLIKNTNFQFSTKPSIAYDRLLAVRCYFFQYGFMIFPSLLLNIKRIIVAIRQKTVA